MRMTMDTPPIAIAIATFTSAAAADSAAVLFNAPHFIFLRHFPWDSLNETFYKDVKDKKKKGKIRAGKMEKIKENLKKHY